MDDSQNTPGLGGYALAVVVSVVVTSACVFVPLLLAGMVESGGPLDAELLLLALWWCYFLAVGMLVAVPLAMVGVTVVHLLCRHQPSQRVHVAVTGLISFTLVLAVLAVMADHGTDLLGLVVPAAVVGASTMVGRASVIPLVRRRQRLPPGPRAFERSNPPRCATGRS